MPPRLMTPEQVAAHQARVRGAKTTLLEYEAGRQARQGQQDDRIETAFQLDGLQQARLMLMQHGYDPRLLMPIDNGSPYERERARRASLGFVFDVPDMLLCIAGIPDAALGRSPISLWIENKQRGKKPRKAQLEMMALLSAQGCKCVVCYSAQEIVEAVLDYLGLNLTPSADRTRAGG